MSPLGRAEEAVYGGSPGTGLGAGTEFRTLETQLQVQHLQEELNTKFFGQLCQNSPPPLPAQL